MINTTNHHVQASRTWDLVKEKAVEGKEAAAEWVKLNCVEKVNSMKENADDGITNSPVRKEKAVEGKESATEKVTLSKEKLVEFFL